MASLEQTGADKAIADAPSDREKWEFEKWAKEKEIGLKEKESIRAIKELELKEIETRRSRWSSPLVLAILATTGAGLGSIASSYFTAYGNRALEKFRATLESQKAESMRLQEMLKVADQRAARNNLDFMVAAKLITDKDVANAVRDYLSKKATTEFPALIQASATPPPCDAAGSPLPDPVPRMSGELANLALLPDSIANASSVYPDPIGARHSIEYLRDGWYNNCRSWVSGAVTGWAEIDLRKDYLVSMVAFGSEHTPFYRDRAPLKFTILGARSSSGADTWIKLFQYDGPQSISDRKEFKFNEQPLRKIRIDIQASERGAPRIDELEIYGRPL